MLSHPSYPCDNCNTFFPMHIMMAPAAQHNPAAAATILLCPDCFAQNPAIVNSPTKEPYQDSGCTLAPPSNYNLLNKIKNSDNDVFKHMLSFLSPSDLDPGGFGVLKTLVSPELKSEHYQNFEKNYPSQTEYWSYRHIFLYLRQGRVYISEKTDKAPRPLPMPDNAFVRKIIVQRACVFFLTHGRVYGMGDNPHGELSLQGRGPVLNPTNITPVEGLRITSIQVTSHYTCYSYTCHSTQNSKMLITKHDYLEINQDRSIHLPAQEIALLDFSQNDTDSYLTFNHFKGIDVISIVGQEQLSLLLDTQGKVYAVSGGMYNSSLVSKTITPIELPPIESMMRATGLYLFLTQKGHVYACHFEECLGIDSEAMLIFILKDIKPVLRPFPAGTVICSMVSEGRSAVLFTTTQGAVYRSLIRNNPHFTPLSDPERLRNLDQEPVVTVVANTGCTFFICPGKVYACGKNELGQLGVGFCSEYVEHPTLIPFPPNTQIDSIFFSNCDFTNSCTYFRDRLHNIYACGLISPTRCTELYNSLLRTNILKFSQYGEGFLVSPLLVPDLSLSLNVKLPKSPPLPQSPVFGSTACSHPFHDNLPPYAGALCPHCGRSG